MTLGPDNVRILYDAWNTSSELGSVLLHNDGTNLYLSGRGATNSGNSSALIAHTWYIVHIHLDATATNSYLSIDGDVTKLTFQAGPTSATQQMIGYFDDGEAVATPFDIGNNYVN